LLLKSRPGTGSSPKGGIEGDEAPADGDQGGVRGGRNRRFPADRRLPQKEYDYVFEANGNTIHKTVHLFIARARSKRAPKSRTNTVTCGGATTIRRSTRSRKQAPRILEDAHDYLDERKDGDTGEYV